MAGTKNRRPTVKTVLRWIQAGYGQGEGEAFKPFMYVRDVPSEGTSSMVSSRVTGRTHHYLSSGEFSVHLLAEYSRSIVDIREQYALLPWEETQEIAAKLGIRHPVIPGTKTPSVLTTDLLLSLKEPDGVRLVAVSFKPEQQLTARTLEKLLLERAYWNRRGITWLLVTDKNLPIRAGNLRFFENAIRNQDALRSGIDPEAFSRRFEQEWKPDRPYIDILRQASNAFSVDSNVGHGLLGAAVWQRKSLLNIDHRLITHQSYITLTK
ncbi:TnsA endonuclease N-terminal domain-containing protein [Roseateles sp.]|uniref:TnsA endonuclease N-terminal domain-containing protein n=1 Tax=Roseateles sp. TaxID=1971397 RepID=UPI00359F97CC